jgi:anti-sigma regulatory factor (Ser/Thr protein kinase)
MSAHASQDGEDRETSSLPCIAEVSRRLAGEPDAAQGLWHLVCAIRMDLRIDRAGIFAYDRLSDTLQRVVGVDGQGNAEFAGESLDLSEAVESPVRQVARGLLPYYHTDDVRRDYPHLHLDRRVRAHAIIPIVAGDALVGTLCVDNGLTGGPIPEGALEALFVYAGLAALPLFALYQKKEGDRTDALRRRIHQEVFGAVTGGKLLLRDRAAIDQEWPGGSPAVHIRQKDDIRVVREAVIRAGTDSGMEEARAGEVGLCASEAATNALVHGNGGEANVEGRNGTLRVRISDHGRGILPDDLPRAMLLKGWSARRSMGLGFTIMKEMADHLYLCTGPDGTTLIIEMSVVPPAESLDVWGAVL